MHGPDAAPFQALRAKMETEWVPQMMQVLGIEPARCRSSGTPISFTGRAMRPGADSYVLCEINVSSCFAIPDEAPAAIAKLVLARCAAPARS